MNSKTNFLLPVSQTPLWVKNRNNHRIQPYDINLPPPAKQKGTANYPMRMNIPYVRRKPFTTPQQKSPKEHLHIFILSYRLT
jgi:hypothetical protein